jgi:adenylate kinase
MGEYMNMILFGPQGSGKGTQAETIAKEFGLFHFSMGDQLRKEIKDKSTIGKKVESIMARGELVPDEITNAIALKVYSDKKNKNGIIFDGYPRSQVQLAFTKKNFHIDTAIELELSEKESIKRIASRRMCPKCGKNYNIIYLKPKVEGYCDDDNTKLVQRDDDKPKAVKDRLKIYYSQTEPLKKAYRDLGILQVIDGNKPIKDVYSDILKVLKK